MKSFLSLVLSLTAVVAAADPGATALEAFLRANGDALDRLRAKALATPRAPRDEAERKLAAALDAACHQRDCLFSHLYWHTDIGSAKAVAAASGKPILSLHLLGRLDEELSCANSRFFRAVLYANENVSRVLRDRFVLHWESVRPVPRITIDFGDGRSLETTVTGNSIHYVLDANGEPLDALPGLYGPKAFLEWLDRVHGLAGEVRREGDARRDTVVSAYHARRLADLRARWPREARHARARLAGFSPGRITVRRGARPSARSAARLAMTKAFVELPAVEAITSPDPASRRALRELGDDAAWETIAARHAGDVALDASSRALMSRQLPETGSPAAPAGVDPFSIVTAGLSYAIALDTIRNEYLLHAELHAWLTEGGAARDLAALDRRVYAELFLTPGEDPWLGLVPAHTYTGLDGNGIRGR